MINKKFSILVVDDEENIVSSLKRLLSKLPNTQVYTSSDPQKALETLESQKIDLIITDYLMPKMTGIQLLEKVMLKDPDIIKIILSAHSEVTLLLEAINKLDLYRFIIKPWRNKELLTIVSNALKWRKLLIENRCLSQELKKRNLILMKLEEKYPGITKLELDSSGAIITEEDQEEK